MHIPLPKHTFINGPAGSGKGTLAKLLCDQLRAERFIESFAQPIRDTLLVNFWPEEFTGLTTLDLTDSAVKKREMPYPRLSEGEKNTVRDAMTSFSEDWMKPRWGKEIFGKLALRRCQENELFYKHFIFDDCGFADELLPIVREEGAHSCLIITLDRPGHTFVGDSRNYIDIPGVRRVNVLNDGTPTDMLAQLQLALGAL